jgi:hypothetical protein
MELKDISASNIEGHLKIWDPCSGQIFLNKRNAIHFENMSQVIANALANNNKYISEMHFGNGGSTIDNVGNITYRLPQITGQEANLYNPTFFKIIDQNNTAYNTDVTANKMEVSHTEGFNYSDIIITATLAYNEPDATDTTFNLTGNSQSNLDNANDINGDFVFDELGLKSNGEGLGLGLLLTHVIFHPIQKSANRVIQVVYTLRFRIGS